MTPEDEMLFAMAAYELPAAREELLEKMLLGSSPLAAAGWMKAAGAPAALASLAGALAWWGRRRERSRLERVLDSGLARGLLRRAGDVLEPTPEGLTFAEAMYRQAGSDSVAAIEPLCTASELCRALERSGGSLSRDELEQEAFPPPIRTGEPGPEALTEAYLAAVPAAFDRGLRDAENRGWVSPAGPDRWQATPLGLSEGAHWFDSMR